MLVVLDSTVIIDCLRGRAASRRVHRLWDLGDTPATTAVNVEEVARGIRPGEERGTRALIGSLVILPVDEAAAWQSGEWRRKLASTGATIAQADCLVAAVTHGHQARLCTGNPKHFPMPELTVEHWPVGV